jgi:predicted transcriptional regulator
MNDKQLVLEAVSQLPDSFSVGKIAEEIDILAAIRRGQEASSLGRVKSHEEVKGMLSSWITK